jgi:hypothetical protein
VKPRQRTLAIVLVAAAVLAVVVAVAVVVDSPLRSLATLRQADDYPLYVMHLYGSYSFDEFLKEGIRAEYALPPSEPAYSDTWGCSVFAALHPGGDLLLGRNFDWFNRPTLLLFTHPPGGYASASLGDISYLGFSTDKPSGSERARLLDAPYMPFDGMNEYGLAVGMMAVPSAQPGQDPQRVTIDSLQAIRLLLDKARSVAEAIDLLQQYNISFEDGPPLHYLVADRSGSSAVLELTGGEMRALRNEQAWQVATNFLLSGYSPEGAKSQCRRYARAYDMLERAGGRLSQQEAMDLLRSVSQDITMWSVVYNLSSGEISVAMGREYGQVHRFKLPMTER